MTNHFDLPGVEARLKIAGVSVARMCREAGISQSTWHRLKFQGKQPRESTQRVVTRAVEHLIGAESVVANGEREAA